MRKGGVQLVLITGARISTLLQRMAYLPTADAYICENGGRIFYPGSSLPLALPITEDMEWRHKHNAAGMLLQIGCASHTFVSGLGALHINLAIPLLRPQIADMMARTATSTVKLLSVQFSLVDCKRAVYYCCAMSSNSH